MIKDVQQAKDIASIVYLTVKEAAYTERFIRTHFILMEIAIILLKLILAAMMLKMKFMIQQTQLLWVFFQILMKIFCTGGFKSIQRINSPSQLASNKKKVSFKLELTLKMKN